MFPLYHNWTLIIPGIVILKYVIAIRQAYKKKKNLLMPNLVIQYAKVIGGKQISVLMEIILRTHETNTDGRKLFIQSFGT